MFSQIVCDAGNENTYNPIEYQETSKLVNNDAICNNDNLNKTIAMSELVGMLVKLLIKE